MNFGLYDGVQGPSNVKYTSVFPEIRPQHPSQWNDEFDGDSLDSKWSILYQSPAITSSSIDGITDQGILKYAVSSIINTSPVPTDTWAYMFAQPFCYGGSFFIHAQGSVTNLSSGNYAGFGIFLMDSLTGKIVESVWQKQNTNVLAFYAQVRTKYSDSVASTIIGSDAVYGSAGTSEYINRIKFQIGLGVSNAGVKFYYGSTNRTMGKMYYISTIPRTIATDFSRMPDAVGFSLSTRSSLDFFRIYPNISDPFSNTFDYE